MPRPMGTQGDDNSPHTEANLSRDFEEFESNRATVSLSQFRLSERSDGATLPSRRRQRRKTINAVVELTHRQKVDHEHSSQPFVEDVPE